MIEKFQKAYVTLEQRPHQSLMSFRVPHDCNILTITVWSIISLQTVIFNVTINGSPLFAGGSRPTITVGGDDFVEVTGLSEAVNKGDIVALDLEQVPQSGVSNIIWQVDFEGVGYRGTSVTSFLIGTGSKEFTTQNDLDYSVGSRIRITSEANPTTNYMEGVVTSYSGTALIVTVDFISGSGTYIDWAFSLAGERGSIGPSGPTGALSTVNHTTVSMADSAEVNETVPDIGKSFIMHTLTADKACRVRVYRNEAFRTADAARPSGTLPTGEHGVVLDITFTAAGTYVLTPIPFSINTETVRVNDAAIAVQNLSGVTGTVTLNFSVFTLE